MSKSLTQILGFQNLCGIIQNPLGGVPANVLPPAAFSITKPIDGNTGSYTRVQGNRQTASIVAYGSPSQRRELKGVSEIPVVLLHSFEHDFHPATVLTALRAMDNPMLQNKGIQLVAQRTGQFRGLFNNLRLGSIYSAFALGKIYFNSAGQLLPSSSGAGLTVDFGIPAANLDNTGLGAWNTASTGILAQIEAVRTSIEKATGYQITNALYGPKIPGLMVNNTEIGKLIQSNNAMQNAFAQDTVPKGIGEDLNWYKARRAFFEDSAGTMQSFFGDYSVTFFPDFDQTWWEILEGSYPVPTNLGGIAADATGASDQYQNVNGFFSYAKLIDDPVAIKQFFGDTFLPAIKVPGAVRVCADVTQAAT